MITGEESVRALTIRQQFAMAAMQGLCASDIITPEVIAQFAVKTADALIAQLNKKVLTEDKGK